MLAKRSEAYSENGSGERGGVRGKFRLKEK